MNGNDDDDEDDGEFKAQSDDEDENEQDEEEEKSSKKCTFPANVCNTVFCHKLLLTAPQSSAKPAKKAKRGEDADGDGRVSIGMNQHVSLTFSSKSSSLSRVHRSAVMFS